MDPPSSKSLRAAGYLAIATAVGHWMCACALSSRAESGSHGEQELRPYVQGSPIARALAIRGWQQGSFAHLIFGLNYLRLAAIPAGARTSLDKLIFAIQVRTPHSVAHSPAQLIFNAFSVATVPGACPVAVALAHMSGAGPKAANGAVGGAAALSLLIH